MNLILLIHLLFTAFMTGVCWFVQIVHYPLFRQIPPESFPNYEKKNFRTGWVVGPAMFLELGSGLWILYDTFHIVFLLNMVWLGIIWLSTALIQMPLHKKLSQGYNERYLRLLVSTNWIRTVFWTLRCMLLTYSIVTGYGLISTTSQS
ncbi:MAG: hypothetical protein AB3N14_06475 [Flavobacteriaceae bacterium]